LLASFPSKSLFERGEKRGVEKEKPLKQGGEGKKKGGKKNAYVP